MTLRHCITDLRVEKVKTPKQHCSVFNVSSASQANNRKSESAPEHLMFAKTVSIGNRLVIFKLYFSNLKLVSNVIAICKKNIFLGKGAYWSNDAQTKISDVYTVVFF